MIGKYLYHFFIYLYPRVAKLISPLSAKAKLWTAGRENIFETISEKIQHETAKRVWFHASSLGEFEQGRPLIEGFKAQYPEVKIVLTFFSPSGYEQQKNYAGADYIFYMPIDSPKNAARFYELIRPECLFLIKYDYWYYYLLIAHQRNVPVFLVSGIFQEDFSFFQWYGKWFRQMLHYISHFFLQNEQSAVLLKNIGITNTTVCGDTRFDRVLEIARQKKEFPELAAFCKNHETIIAGSTWHEDEKELRHFAHTHPEMRFVIAPHDISQERIAECKKIFINALLHSEYLQLYKENKPLPSNINVLIINNIGMLKYLYRYGTVCIIGGGFRGDGIHNILEAAVYYKPVLFGPEHDKSLEALELIEAGGAFDVKGALELEEELMQLMHHPLVYEKACIIAGNYVKNKAGATQEILRFLHEKRLITN